MEMLPKEKMEKFPEIFDKWIGRSYKKLQTRM